MKYLKLSLFFLFITSNAWTSSTLIQGKVLGEQECFKNTGAMVTIAYKDTPNQFLYQVMVVQNGSFDFWVRPGEYILEAVTKEFCQSQVEIKMKSQNKEISLKVSKGK